MGVVEQSELSQSGFAEHTVVLLRLHIYTGSLERGAWHNPPSHHLQDTPLSGGHSWEGRHQALGSPRQHSTPERPETVC